MEVYPVNPESLAKFRKALYPSGAKSDPTDAELLGQMVRQNPGRFRAWVPVDEQTRGWCFRNLLLVTCAQFILTKALT
jgi:hypothetical protein